MFEREKGALLRTPYRTRTHATMPDTTLSLSLSLAFCYLLLLVLVLCGSQDTQRRHGPVRRRSFLYAPERDGIDLVGRTYWGLKQEKWLKNIWKCTRQVTVSMLCAVPSMLPGTRRRRKRVDRVRECEPCIWLRRVAQRPGQWPSLSENAGFQKGKRT